MIDDMVEDLYEEDPLWWLGEKGKEKLQSRLLEQYSAEEIERYRHLNGSCRNFEDKLKVILHDEKKYFLDNDSYEFPEDGIETVCLIPTNNEEIQILQDFHALEREIEQEIYNHNKDEDSL